MTKIFRWLPVPFWCYFLPMIASSLGWLPRESGFYTFVSRQILPVCLVLLLIGTDLKTLSRIGGKAAALMLAGAVGTILGAFASFFLYKPFLPAGSWGAVGALTGSWIGGSANMLAVKEALEVPDALIGPVIILDAVVAYSWMGLLIAAAAWQEKWDRRVTRPESVPAQATSRVPVLPGLFEKGEERGASAGALYGLRSLIFAILLSWIAQRTAGRLPIFPGFTASTWTVVLVTTAALALAATPLRRLGESGASRIGTWALYLLLVTIGARADLRAVLTAPVFLLLGLTWIAVHGLVLLAAGYFCRAPLGLIATASQANIGGVVSAPMVGASYSKELAGLGLLMAVLGNILGTYLGLMTGWALR
ncbi:MAG: DUF819 family protein [Candidatus Omnitrophota bacterium]|nr:DUF819 family protein [Candidatus Omnitrophota bacterium]